MNFDADRLARLSGLEDETVTETLTESANNKSQLLNEECGRDHEQHNVTMMNEEDDDVLFEVDEEEDYAGPLEDGAVLEEEDPKASVAADNSPLEKTSAEAQSNATDNLKKIDFSGPLDPKFVEALLAVQKLSLEDTHSLPHVDESTVLNMNTLRETVIELRNEILEEQAAEQQALAEAPARKAIRKEIQALLSGMPGDAATNWMYGKKGRPSASDTAAANKSRATALFGLGFETN
jgi:hypothetical protein